MKLIAIEKAQKRLAKARSAITKVEAAANHHEFESAWSDFLTCINQVYTIIEKGASAKPQSRQWFGSTKKKECKNDPLIQYLLQARNVDEHGLEPVAQHISGSLSINALPGKMLHIESLSHEPSGVHAVLGTPAILEVTPPHPKLISVKDDRYGTTFHPPLEHLGLALIDTSPVAVGKLGLAYFDNLILEASALV